MAKRKKMSQLIAKIIPQTRLPRGFNFFDYLIPPEMNGKITAGSLVRVPFGGREIDGIVFEKADSSELETAKLKNISAVLDAQYLPSGLVSLIGWVSDDLYLPRSTVLTSILPTVPKKKSGSRKIFSLPPSSPLSLKRSRIDQLVAIHSMIAKSSGNVLVHYQSEEEKNALIYKIIEAALKNNEQTILISPTINGVQKWQSQLSKIAGPRLAALHGELNKTDYFSNWQRLQSGQATIVVGTRQAIFSPFKNCRKILIDQAESEDLKQSDQNPRYDARTVAYKKAETDGSQVYLFSQSPRIQDYFLSQTGKLSYLTILSSGTKQTELINLDIEINRPAPIISEPLATSITECLQKGGKTFLLVNKRGFAGSLTCKDCGKAVECSNCGLVMGLDKGNLNCRNCARQTPAPIACPKCQGPNLAELGQGIQRIEQQLKKIFPAAEVDRVDSDKPSFSPTANIVLGTPTFLYRYFDLLENFSLLAVVSIDNLISVPEFGSQEKANQLLVKLVNFAETKEKPLIVQTFQPNNPSIKSAVTLDFKEFYDSQLKERKAFSYPPFGRLIKISLQTETAFETSNKINQMSASLKKNLPVGFQLLGPSAAAKVHNKFKSSLVIKFAPENKAKIDPIMAKLPPEYIIDLDPISLL